MNFSGLVIFLAFLNFIYAGMNPVLFFDWKEEKLVEMSKDEGEAVCKSCISTCPVGSDSFKEKLINDNVSITGNSIFFHRAYPENTSAKEMETEDCENSFTPALAWNSDIHSYEIGYELYYEKGAIKSKYSTYDFYAKIIDGKPKPERGKQKEENPLKTDRSGENLSSEIVGNPEKKLVTGVESSSERAETFTENPIKIHKIGENTEFEIVAEKGKNWMFYWIQVLSFEISENRDHRFVTFTPDIINDYIHKVGTIHYCDTYFTGDGRMIEKKNSAETNVDVQAPDTEPQLKKKLKRSSERLIKAQIIPMSMFHTYSARLATCVFLNFAFIWESIASEMLKKIDLFLYAVYREWAPIIISFGVYGNLEESNSISSEEIESEDVFLDFPTPTVMYRLMEISGIDEQRYGVAIVIHNDLEPVKYADRICSIEDEVEGWSFINEMNNGNGFTYTCSKTTEVLMKLGFDGSIATASSTKPLNLKKFPQTNNTTEQIDYITLLENIRKRITVFKE